MELMANEKLGAVAGQRARDLAGRQAARQADQPDEAELIARARSGDPAAIDMLVQSHGARVYRRLYRLAGPSRDLNELTQTVFLHALRGLPRFRGDSSFATWLEQITCRVAYRSAPRRDF